MKEWHVVLLLKLTILSFDHLSEIQLNFALQVASRRVFIVYCILIMVTSVSGHLIARFSIIPVPMIGCYIIVAGGNFSTGFAQEVGAQEILGERVIMISIGIKNPQNMTKVECYVYMPPNMNILFQVCTWQLDYLFCSL